MVLEFVHGSPFPQLTNDAYIGIYVLLLICLRLLPCRDGISDLMTLPDDQIWEIDADWGIAVALNMLSHELGGDDVIPGINCRGVFCAAVRPPVPKGRVVMWYVCCLTTIELVFAEVEVEHCRVPRCSTRAMISIMHARV